MNALRRFFRKNRRGIVGAALLGIGVNILMPDLGFWRYLAGAIFLMWGVECLAVQEARDDADLRAREARHA